MLVPDVRQDTAACPPQGSYRGGAAEAGSQLCAGPSPTDTVASIYFLSVIFRGKCGVPMGTG